MKVLEALLNLNATFMLEGYKGDFVIKLCHEDFAKFLSLFQERYQIMEMFPDISERSIRNIKQIKIPGPGSYFLIEQSEEKK